MLTLTDRGPGVSRRGFLTAGALGLGGLTLPSLLRAAADAPPHVTGRSVIFLFQQGGPSQFETFDPKPDAPDGTRTIGDTVQTSVPGVRFGETMAQLAPLADKLTVVRSYQTNNGGHNVVPLVSADTQNAYLGTLVARAAGATSGSTGVPTSAVLFPQAVTKDATSGKARGDLSATGGFGQAYAPFVPGGGGQLQANMTLHLDRDRLEDRRQLLAALTDLNRRAEAAPQSRDPLHDQAVQMLLGGGVATALDLSKEDARTVAAYDTAGYVPAHGWKKAKRGAAGMYSGQAKSIGKLLLTARRLCEAGCGFVTVHADYDGVWDMHADGNNLNVADGMQAVGKSFDHAVAAFVRDVEARGLQDKIMLVCCGEMGRTPKINKNGGRDHWGKLSPLVVYGGGAKPGVIGQSARDGGEPASANFTPKHLISTILRTVFDAGVLRVLPEFAAVSKLAEHDPIAGVR